ncbi:MAG: virulence factor [Gammaproteobacteria bacterium]|nr:virulence factor [Gammaproteobacteria bacterium]
MERCLIVFDLDTKCLADHYHNKSWSNAYCDIRKVLTNHRFTNIQGTVYLSDVGVRQAHGTIALQQVAIKFPWFERCVSNVQFYDLAADFNAQFIVDGIAQAREGFEQKLHDLRKQMLQAGLDEHKVEEIIQNQQFSIENTVLGEPQNLLGKNE